MQKFEYHELKFNPQIDDIKSVYDKIINIRDKTIDSLKSKPELLAMDSIAEETIKMLLNSEAEKRNDDIRIYKSLEFFYQNLEAKKINNIYINNNLPVGPQNNKSACEAIMSWRRPYDYSDMEALKEVKTIIFSKRIAKNSEDQKAITHKYLVMIGCGDERFLAKGTSMVKETGLAIPYTINPATIILSNIAPKIIYITDNLTKSQTVSNNLGSRMISCTAKTDDYIFLIKNKYGSLVKHGTFCCDF